MSKVFREAHEQALEYFVEAVRADMKHEDFEWDILAKSINDEASILGDTFSDKTKDLAYLFEQSIALNVAADNANLLDPDIGEEDA